MPSTSLFRLAAVLCAFVLTTPVAFAQRLESGLVAYYPLDGSLDEATDVVGTPVARGTLEYDVGAVGRAAKLSGDDEIDFNGIPAATFGGDFTVAWFMNLARSSNHSFFGKQSTCSTSNYFTTNLGKGTDPDDVSFVLSNTTTSASATNAMRYGTWVHVAVVRSGASAVVFIDGRPGTARALPNLSLGAITAPFGLGNSPCVGTIGANAVSRPIGRFDEVRVYNVALQADVIADLARRPVFTATPRAASVGGKVAVRATHLVVDRTYQLRLRGPTTIDLFNGPATAESMAWTVTIPNVPLGDYKFELTTNQLRFRTIERGVPFTVVPQLAIVPSAPLQAGKRAVFAIGNLAPGSVRLLYSGRVIAGPTLVTGTSHTFKLTLPTDLPASLPASVALRAELLDGRIASRIGTASVSVAAPFTGKFASAAGVVSSRTIAAPNEVVSLTGRITLADGTRGSNLGFSAYWVGDNGDITPLPTSSLALDDAGNVRLDTRPPSTGAMTATIPKSAGRVRLVSKRTNESGRQEWVVEDGPSLETDLDTDPDTDITVIVRKRSGAGQTVPLEGAYVVLDSAAPIAYSFDLPGNEPLPSGGGAVGLHREPRLEMRRIFGGARPSKAVGYDANAALNQVNNETLDLPPAPPPVCGENLYRRYTDSQGRATFPIAGGPDEEPSTWQNLMSRQVTAHECGSLGCNIASIVQRYEFHLTVYTLHKGAGTIKPGLSNEEKPTRFLIRYDRTAEQFEIRNLATNEVTTQSVSANIIVEVPTIAADNFVTISDPFMYQEIGSEITGFVTKTDGGFGRWIDFTDTRVSEFLNPAPTRVLRFGHKPDANGSLTSAKLYLRNLVTGQPAFIGDFQPTGFVEGCNLQDDPSVNGTEAWVLKIDEALTTSWRYPQGVYFNGSDRKACGHIEVRNAAGGLGKRAVCFYWQAAPAFMYEPGGSIAVDDSDMQHVQVARDGVSYGAAATTVPKRSTDFYGEPIEKPGRIDNSTQASGADYASVGAYGVSTSARMVAGQNPEQYSAPAAGASSVGSLPEGIDELVIGDPDYQTILDETFPLFQWYWGVPEILSAEVYARLRLFASYLFTGMIRLIGETEETEITTNAVFGAAIMIGVDIDVLFGFIIDAGAALTGAIISELPVEYRNGAVQSPGPCITFDLRFDGYVDPCAFCPTPVIEFGDEILAEQVPQGCSFYSARNPDSELAKTLKGAAPRFGFPEARSLRRHATIGFDSAGNGQMLMRDDAGNLVASTVAGQTLSPEAQLSTAVGVRDPLIAYYDADRAVAVWAESALTVTSMGQFGAAQTSDAARAEAIAAIARNQRIAWAEWDGDSWSEKRFLTTAGKGDGQLSLTACADGETNCPDGGEALAMWQRDENGDARNPANRLYYAQFRPATGFGAASPVDPTPTSGVQDVTPSVTYLNGLPVAVWTRQFGGSLSNFSQRNLAYRVLPAGAVVAVGSAPGATAPSVVAGDFSSIRVAYLRADPNLGQNAANAGAVGTQHALHVTRAGCNATICSFPTTAIPPARDQSGRKIYGERPRLIRTSDDAIVVMRAFRFEGENGEPVQTGDPIGTVLNSGDIVTVSPNFVTGVSRVVPITADGAMHMGAFGAYDPISRTIVTGSSTFVPQGFAPLREALKATGHKGHVAYGKTIAAVGPIEVRSMIAAPDLAIERLTASGTLAPNAAMSASVRIGNRGTGFVGVRDGVARVLLRWNSPGGPVVGTATLADVPQGGAAILSIAWTAPDTAFADEAHTLHATIDVPDGLDEITDDNNAATHAFPGLPVPERIAASIVRGVPHVQLGWAANTDPRIEGYRVYRKDAAGTWMPMGASPTHGFLDLSASFGVPRTYAVASYSARGVESELSDPITAMPVPVNFVELLNDGFEDAAP